jgi:hypothetical protein
MNTFVAPPSGYTPPDEFTYPTVVEVLRVLQRDPLECVE